MASKRTFQGGGGVGRIFLSFSRLFSAVISWEFATRVVWVCVRCMARCLSSIFLLAKQRSGRKKISMKKNSTRVCVCVGDFLFFILFIFFLFFFFTLHPPRLRNDVFRMFVDALHNIVWRLIRPKRPKPMVWATPSHTFRMVNAMMTQEYIKRRRNMIELGECGGFSARSRWGDVAQYVID